MIRALIIDDEPPACDALRALLSDHGEVVIAGEAGTMDEARARLAGSDYDLVLLDIQLRGGSGFDLVPRVRDGARIIFVTAYDQHALRAFEVNALDYLMKPVHPQRLAAAVAKVRARLAPASSATDPDERPDEPTAPLREDDSVFVREGDRCWFIPVRSLRLLEADGNHTRLYFGEDRPLLYRTLGAMETRLPASLFLRANRAQLVNLSFIEKVEPWFSGSIKVRLRGGPEVEFSRRQAQLFRERTSL